MPRPTDQHRQALAHLRKQEWDKAHRIVMQMRDKLAFRIHGLLHRIEGDLDNARYWYDRAGTPFSESKSVRKEITDIEALLNR
jgi:hypothetical protein